MFFTFLGVVFLFDKGLLAMGNVSVQDHSSGVLLRGYYPHVDLMCVSQYVLSDSLLVWSGIDNWTEIHSAILHETSKLQGLCDRSLCLSPFFMNL